MNGDNWNAYSTDGNCKWHVALLEITPVVYLQKHSLYIGNWNSNRLVIIDTRREHSWRSGTTSLFHTPASLRTTHFM